MTTAGTTLVTGAYGLIGHAVVAELSARGYPVVATDQLETPPPDAVFDALPLMVEGVETLTGFLEGHRIETIVHAAGISGPMLARDQPHAVFRVNAGGTLDLFEAARQSGVKRIVLLSSASVYGRTADEAINEVEPLRSIDVYGASKIAGEAIARAYAARHAVEAVMLRPGWVYGPRRRTACVIRTMIADALAGRPTNLTYGRGFPRQFVHVDDIARAVVAAIFSAGASGRAFNLTDGTRRTLDEVASVVRSILPQARIDMDLGEDPDDNYVGQLDLSEAAERLGWRPAVSLETGIRSYATFLSGVGQLLSDKPV